MSKDAAEDYLTYEPTSFLAPPIDFTTLPSPIQQKEKRRRKNAIAQMHSPPVNSFQDLIPVGRQQQQQQQQQQHGRKESTESTGSNDRSTDSILTNPYSLIDDNKSHQHHALRHHKPTGTRRRRSEGIKRSDGTYTTGDKQQQQRQQQQQPHWQMAGKRHSVCDDYSLDQLFSHVGRHYNAASDDENNNNNNNNSNNKSLDTSLESFASTTTSASSLSITSGFGTDSESDVMSPYASYSALHRAHAPTSPPCDIPDPSSSSSRKKLSSSSDGAFDKDRSAEEVLFAKSVSKNRRPSSVTRQASTASTATGLHDCGHVLSSSCPSAVHVETSPEKHTRRFLHAESDDGDLPSAPSTPATSTTTTRQDRIASLPATVNNKLVLPTGKVHAKGSFNPSKGHYSPTYPKGRFEITKGDISPMIVARKTRLKSLPAIVNRTFSPEKPLAKGTRKLSLEQSIERLTLNTRKTSVVSIESVL